MQVKTPQKYLTVQFKMSNNLTSLQKFLTAEQDVFDGHKTFCFVSDANDSQINNICNRW